ncbi:hypothetical protein Tco_0912583, partial [Tanacetum coccineum]
LKWIRTDNNNYCQPRVFLEGTPIRGTLLPGVLGGDTYKGVHYCPGVLGGDTYKGYITAQVFLEGTPAMGIFVMVRTQRKLAGKVLEIIRHQDYKTWVFWRFLSKGFVKKIVWTAKAQKKVWSAKENKELQSHAATATIVSAVCQANDHGFGRIRIPKQKRNTGIESYELMIDLQSIRDPESIHF